MGSVDGVLKDPPMFFNMVYVISGTLIKDKDKANILKF